MNPDLAWAAGLFEGEGCFNVYQRPSGKLQVQMRLSMTDRDVVERFAQVVGYGSMRSIRRANSPQRKDLYEWYIYRAAEVDALIGLLLPWFGERRRAKALEVQAASRLVEPHNRERTHCPKGHAYADGNLQREKIIRAGRVYFARRCKVCRKEQEQARYLRAKEAA